MNQPILLTSPKPEFGQKLPTKATLALQIPSIMDKATAKFDRLLATCTITRSGCLIWPQSLNEFGYGYLQIPLNKAERQLVLDNYGIEIKAVNITAHRFAYFLKVNKVRSGGSLSHICHNRACVNASHLEMGTHQQNIIEKVTARRHFKGFPEAKWTHSQLVEAVLPIYKGEKSRYRVWKETGISRPYLSRILNGQLRPKVLQEVKDKVQGAGKLIGHLVDPLKIDNTITSIEANVAQIKANNDRIDSLIQVFADSWAAQSQTWKKLDPQ